MSVVHATDTLPGRPKGRGAGPLRRNDRSTWQEAAGRSGVLVHPGSLVADFGAQRVGHVG